jgi:hypothetical protein
MFLSPGFRPHLATGRRWAISLPLYGHALLPNGGGVLIVGAGSSLVRLDGNGQLVSATRLSGLGTLTSAVLIGSPRLLVGGERGVFQGPTAALLRELNEVR